MNIKLFFKGVLLYVTLLICMLTAMGIDSLYDQGYFIWAVIIVAGLIYWCKKIITKEELDILSFDNFFKRHGL